MSQAPFRLVDMKGLSPAVEPTRSQDFFALNGRNYVFDTKGPKSFFGNRYLLPQKLARPAHAQGCRVKLRDGNRTFTIANDAILEWSEALGGWSVVYDLPDTSNQPNRWTSGYLNGYLFLCHPRTGILVYDIATGVCRPHNGPGVPESALAVTIDNGRLCVMTPTHFVWSAPSDGMEFTPQLGGAGFQLIANHVSGRPIALTSYTAGCFVWTTGGVMRSEYVGDAQVYRHRPIQTEYCPINSFCTCKIDDDTVVILDKRGLFRSKGEAPEPFTPLFNEFLANRIQSDQLDIGTNVRIEWDELQRHMYISMSLSYADPIYEQCFVLYSNLDKWGQFNEPHYGILPIRIDQSNREGNYYGYVDSDGRVRYFLPTGSRELRVEDSATINTLVERYPTIQRPTGFMDGDSAIRICAAAGSGSGYPTIHIDQPAGFYLPDGSVPAAPALTGLNSLLQFGLFRPDVNQSADELAEILNLTIRSVAQGDPDELAADFSLTPANAEGWDLGTGISYDLENTQYVNHELRIISTLDGNSAYQSTVPDLVGYSKTARYYACSIPGIWFILEIGASQVGEAYHLKTLELTATAGGRLL